MQAASYDVVIVGAGPAGLAAADALSRRTENYLLVEAGAAIGERDRYAPRSVTAGVGGAGLFSDGKFSFFPAASALWRLRDRGALHDAYDETVALLLRHGLRGPP